MLNLRLDRSDDAARQHRLRYPLVQNSSFPALELRSGVLLASIRRLTTQTPDRRISVAFLPSSLAQYRLYALPGLSGSTPICLGGGDSRSAARQ